MEFSDAVQSGSQGCPDLCVSVWDFTQNRILAVGTEAKPLLAASLLCHLSWGMWGGAVCLVLVMFPCAADTAV